MIPPGARDAAPALEGDLRHFFATEVLQFLQLAGATGRLEIERRGERAEIAFAGGRPVSARTTGRSVRLGDVLVHRAGLPREALESALDAQRRQPGELLGTVLVRAGEASAEEVSAAVAEVFRRLVCCLALWPDGRFRFVPVPAGGEADVPLDAELDRLLLEGLHQADLAQAEA
jgi:hypothetical protein